jgi:hypothetical protein
MHSYRLIGCDAAEQEERMSRFTQACTLAAACTFAVSVSAQDTTVKSKTKIDADDAHVVTMTGCLQQGPTAGVFLLSGATMVKGDDLTSKTKTKIDVDDDETEVKTKDRTEIEHDDDKAVGTSGIANTFELTPKEGVDLTAHVGHKVELTAVALDAAKKGGDDDAKIEMKTDTKVTTEDAPDARVKSKTKAELPRGANAKLTVMSVKEISPSCTM